MINQKAIDKLQLRDILAEVSKFAVSGVAKNKILNIAPATSFEEEQSLLLETKQGCDLFRFESSFDLSIDDLSEICSLARVGSCLSMSQILAVMRLLRTSRTLQVTLLADYGIDISVLRTRAYALYCDKQLEDDIDFAIISEEEMNDKASNELYAIRKRIKAINADIKQKLQSYTHSGEMSKYLQDSIVTIRGDRYVIPVKQEYKGYVNGIVHDQSSTGATLFIEPMAIVELNNSLRSALIEEKAEVQRILQTFTDRIGAVAERLKITQQAIVEIDIIFARVKYALENKCTEPLVNNKGIICLKKARHPLLNKSKVVPISVELGRNYDIIVVTGPNTGGKTVTLKTIGLMCLMAQCGLFLPCYDGSVISFFDDVFCDIGDEQSIEQNLSTFSGHIVNLRNILDVARIGNLVLVDEVGAGTEPNEGAALALAITDCLRKSGAKCVITTHYSLLKEYSLSTERVENASMEFDMETLAPTYKLVMGVPGSSNAIAIASKLGLRGDVIAEAKANVADDNKSFENVLQNADAIRKQYEQKLEEAKQLEDKLKLESERTMKLNDSLQNERNKLLAGSREEAQKIIDKAKEQANEIIDELKQILKSAELSDKDLFSARSKIKELNNIEYDDKNNDEEIVFTGDKVELNKLNVGDVVYSKKLSVKVKIAEIKGSNKIVVKCGNVSTTLNIDDLYYCVTEKNKTAKRQYGVKHNAKSEINANRSAHNEINVIGQTVDEAIANIDSFIDSAVLSGLSKVWIIHGNGTGRLRAGIHGYLKGLLCVDSYRLGEYGEGESGVTVVTFK